VNHRTAIIWARNPLIAALLLVAFCARALVPVGFMPGPGGLVICDGHAPAQGALASTVTRAMSSTDMDMPGMDMGVHAAQQGGHASNKGGAPAHEQSTPCVFAAAATTMATAHAYAPGPVVTAHVVALRITLSTQPIAPRGTLVPTRLPRGPPDFA
jgi:hypothetical protein